MNLRLKFNSEDTACKTITREDVARALLRHSILKQSDVSFTVDETDRTILLLISAGF